MAALVEPSDSAHHAADASKEDAGVSSATQDLSRRFEEMDFDHDGAVSGPAAGQAVHSFGACCRHACNAPGKARPGPHAFYFRGWAPSLKLLCTGSALRNRLTGCIFQK